MVFLLSELGKRITLAPLKKFTVSKIKVLSLYYNQAFWRSRMAFDALNIFINSSMARLR
jgi:hypothetical protein